MKIRCTPQGLACIGVTLAAVLQAAREPTGPGLPPFALGLTLLAALLLRAESARPTLTALGFLFCAVASASFLVRVPVPFASDTDWYAAPSVLLLCIALGARISSRPRNREPVPASMQLAVAACGVAGTLGYLFLVQTYPLDSGVLRTLVLNCALAFAGWTLLLETKPGKGLSSIVCAGLLLSGGMILS